MTRSMAVTRTTLAAVGAASRCRKLPPRWRWRRMSGSSRPPAHHGTRCVRGWMGGRVRLSPFRPSVYRTYYLSGSKGSAA